jgi:hypothetical protein
VVVVSVPKLTLTALALQRGADRKGVAVTAGCNLACAATATGFVLLPNGKKVVLRRAARSLAPGVKQKLVLLIPASGKAGIVKAFRQGKRLGATITVKVAGGATVVKRVKLAK